MVEIKFSIEEINFLMAVLSERPFKETAALILRIKEDAEKQLVANQQVVESEVQDAA